MSGRSLTCLGIGASFVLSDKFGLASRFACLDCGYGFANSHWRLNLASVSRSPAKFLFLLRP
jgi:hypothetical protein